MNNRSFTYSRLINYEETVTSRRDSSTDDDADSSSSTKLRRLHVGQKKERWPGSASHLTSFSSSDAQREYIEHLIKPEETLQGLALLYRCTVFELKLANNIQKETEFFARRTLKIPVCQHSSLTEKLPSENQSSESSIPSLRNTTTSLSPSNSSEFLKQVDQDLERLKEKARVYDIDSNDLPISPSDEDLRRTARLNRTDCQGDDCGLSWSHILGLALLVLLACPLLYFLYLELNLHNSMTEHTRNDTLSASLNVSDAL